MSSMEPPKNRSLAMLSSTPLSSTLSLHTLHLESGHSEESRLQGQDSGYAYVILIAATLAQLAIISLYSCMGVFYVEFLDHFRESRSYTASPVTLMTGFMGASALFSGFLVHRFGYRASAFVSFVVSTLSTSVSAFATSILQLIFTLGVIQGICMGIAMVSLLVPVQSYFNKRRPLAVGICMAGHPVAFFLWSPICKWLVDLYAWRGAMLILAGVSLQGCVLTSLLRPFVHTSKKLQNTKLKSADAKAAEKLLTNTSTNQLPNDKLLTKKTVPQRLATYLGLNKRLLNRTFIIFCIACHISWSSFTISYAFMVDKALLVGVEYLQASLLVSFIGATEVFGRPAFGLIGSLHGVNRMMFFGLAFILQGIIMNLIFVFSSFASLGVCCVLIGLCQSCYQALQATVVLDIVGLELFPTGLGIIYLCDNFGFLYSGPLAAYLVDVTKNYDLTFQLFGSCEILGGVLIEFMVWRNFRQGQPKNVVFLSDNRINL